MSNLSYYEMRQEMVTAVSYTHLMRDSAPFCIKTGKP